MTRQIELLQAARGIAAVLILMVHANAAVPTAFFIDWGRYSLELFFVISGYVIYFVHRRRAFDLKAYALARLWRIYPPYLPIGIAAALTYVWLGRDVDWLASLTLLPGEPALIPAWTLQQEMVFYVLVGLFFALRAPLRGAAIWAALILIRQLVPVEMSLWESALFHPVNLCFVAGMLLARLEVVPKMNVAAPLRLLGDASYSIYLVHLPLQGLLWRLGFGFLEMVLASIAAGILYHFAVEKPLLAWRKRPRPKPAGEPLVNAA